MRTKDIGAICPSCGRNNDCQVDSGRKCWCYEVPVDKTKLEQELKDKSKDQCLCRGCLRKLGVQ